MEKEEPISQAHPLTNFAFNSYDVIVADLLGWVKDEGLFNPRLLWKYFVLLWQKKIVQSKSRHSYLWYVYWEHFVVTPCRYDGNCWNITFYNMAESFMNFCYLSLTSYFSTYLKNTTCFLKSLLKLHLSFFCQWIFHELFSNLLFLARSGAAEL